MAHDVATAVARARGPVLVTGFGLGAFADGIVLHQVLQWHHLVVEYRDADDLAGLEHNTFWDGVFHVAAWLVVVGGLAWLVRARPDLRLVGLRRVLGWTLTGWGAFHVVDQVVFHLALGAHHIRMVDDYQLYDWGYTAIGGLLVLVGVLLTRRAGSADDADRPRQPQRT